MLLSGIPGFSTPLSSASTTARALMVAWRLLLIEANIAASEAVYGVEAPAVDKQQYRRLKITVWGKAAGERNGSGSALAAVLLQHRAHGGLSAMQAQESPAVAVTCCKLLWLRYVGVSSKLLLFLPTLRKCFAQHDAGHTLDMNQASAMVQQQHISTKNRCLRCMRSGTTKRSPTWSALRANARATGCCSTARTAAAV